MEMGGSPNPNDVKKSQNFMPDYELNLEEMTKKKSLRQMNTEDIIAGRNQSNGDIDIDQHFFESE